MNCHKRKARVFGHLGDPDGVFMLAIPTCAAFQCHRNLTLSGCRPQRLDNFTGQRFIAHQRGTACDVADLFRRAPHVEINNLRP